MPLLSAWPALPATAPPGRHPDAGRGLRSGGGLDGLQNDAGYDAGVRDHGQVRCLHFGDVGVCVLGHGQLQRRRDGVVRLSGMIRAAMATPSAGIMRRSLARRPVRAVLTVISFSGGCPASVRSPWKGVKRKPPVPTVRHETRSGYQEHYCTSAITIEIKFVKNLWTGWLMSSTGGQDGSGAYRYARTIPVVRA